MANPLITDPLELQFQHEVKPGRPFFDFSPPTTPPREEGIFKLPARLAVAIRPKKSTSPSKSKQRSKTMPSILRSRSPAAPPASSSRRHSSAMPSSSTPSTTAQPQTSTTTPPHDTILFPKVYSDAWGMADTSRSDLERARIFLLRFTNMSADPALNTAVRDIVADQAHNPSVIHLASSIQHRIFGNRHAEFRVTPILQATRFMLIRAGIPDVGRYTVSGEVRAVLDFFFDPTLERNLDPAPMVGEMVGMRYPSGRLKVCIIGGGPTGLASAISLAEKGKGGIEVHVWERRWVVREDGVVDYPASARRRDQVVTLQDSVTSLLTERSYAALFAGRPERVWPGSANIQIRKVEDRFLKRCQDGEFRGLIHLHAEGVTREELAGGKCGDFHVLLGTDGAASWVRGGYFRGYEKERGRSYALGLAFDRGAKGGLPWSQPLNMFLTLGQTRYLLNASDHDGRGYLNMQLTEEEWHKMVAGDGQPVHFGRPGCLRREDGSIPEGFDESRVFAPSQERDSNLWKSIEDGLKLFGFKESEVINVVRIPIVVQAVREGVRQLPLEDSRFVRRPHALVAVAGDAAMTVHFWPGRGLNSGIKAGLALGDEIMHALERGQFVGLQLSAMKEYNDFIMKLQGREHDKRSIPILNQSGSPEMLGWLLRQAQSVPDTVAIEWLVGAMVQIAERLEQRGDWYFPKEVNVEAQIRIVLRQMHSLTLREMAVSFPWPTREMAGAEVLPIRSMKPEEKQKWVQQLWGMLSVERIKEASSKARSAGPPQSGSNARFEAPRPPRAGARSPSPNPLARIKLENSAAALSGAPNTLDPSVGSLRRSNAGKSSNIQARRYSNTPTLPVGPVPPAVPATIPAPLPTPPTDNNMTYRVSPSPCSPPTPISSTMPYRNGNDDLYGTITIGSQLTDNMNNLNLRHNNDNHTRNRGSITESYEKDIIGYFSNANTSTMNPPRSPSPFTPYGETDTLLGRDSNIKTPGYMVSPPLSSTGYSGGGYGEYGAAYSSNGGPVGGDFGGGLTRLLSVKRPNGSVLSEAMSLALFRVDED